MSSTDHAAKKPTRKKTSQESFLEQRRKSRSKNRGKVEPADWASIDKDILSEFIAAVTAQGITLSLGYTRDGGAFYVSFYDGKESEREYIKPTEDPDAVLQAITVEFIDE